MNKVKTIGVSFFSFLAGAIIFGGIAVYATSAYSAANISYRNSNVKDILDSLYSLSPVNKFCTYQDSTFGNASNHYSVGTKYTCNLGDGVTRNFYVLSSDDNSVNLIADENIKVNGSYVAMNWSSAMKYFDSGAGKSLKDSWTNVVDVSLPDVNDIVKAVGNTTWHYEDTGYDDWFYFDPIDNVYGQTSSKGYGNLSAYRWIFGNLMDCYQYGCEQSQSNSVWEARGYWTKSPVYRNTDNLNRTWLVLRNGYLERYSITDSSSIGVRPVVTVLKSGLNTNNS